MNQTVLEHRAATAARWCVIVSMAATPLVFWRALLTPFALPKLTVLAVLVVAGAASLGIVAILQHRVEVPFAPALVAALAFLAVAAVSVATTGAVWRTLVGQRGRASGLALYVLCAIALYLLLVVGRDLSRLRDLASAIVVSSAAVAAYCLLQTIGADPLDWPPGALQRFSTMGNSNGVSGFLGATLALQVWAAVGHADRRWRIGGAATAAASVLAILATRSAQGIPAAVAGAALLALVWLPAAVPRLRRLIVAGVLAAVALSVIVIGSGLAGAGPFQRIGGDVGFAQRQYFWGAAIDMTRDHPVTGVGFDGFGNHYRAYRSAEAASLYGVAHTADEPHSVPLGMFANGGIPLGVAYAAFVGLTGLALVRGLRTHTAERQLLLAGFGGTWLGYQVQSLVSIETPPLALLHWLVAGAILLMSGELTWWTYGRPSVAPSRKRQPRRQRARRLTTGERTAVGMVCAATAGAVWLVTLPARADRWASDASSTSDVFEAAAAIDSAIDAVPWESAYWAEKGKLVAAIGQPEEALELFAEAVRREPRSFEYTLNAARAADTADDVAAAERYYQRALELDPHEPDLKGEVGGFYVSSGQPERALPLLRTAVRGRPDAIEAQIHLGEALLALGSDDEAVDLLRAAAERLSPSERSLEIRAAEVLANGGANDAAIDVLRDLLVDAPNDARVMTLLGQLLVREGDVDEAVRVLERALEITPGDADVVAALADARAKEADQ